VIEAAGLAARFRGVSFRRGRSCSNTARAGWRLRLVNKLLRPKYGIPGKGAKPAQRVRDGAVNASTVDESI
jgi:hypothetical protein